MQTIEGINWQKVLPQLEGMKDAEMQTLFTDCVKHARKEAHEMNANDAAFIKKAVASLHAVFMAAEKDILPRSTALQYAVIGVNIPLSEHPKRVEQLSDYLESGQTTFGMVMGPSGGLVRLANAEGKPTAMASALKEDNVMVRFGKVTRKPRSGGGK